MTEQLSKFADNVFEAVKGYIARTVLARVEALEKRAPEKGEKGEKGDKGDQGERGLSAYEVAVEKGFDGDETAWLLSLKGADGISIKGDPGEVDHDRIIAEVVARIPVPKDGLNGRDGKDGESIKGDKGEDGKDADPEAIKRDVLEQVTKALESIPAPRDGKDADPEFIRAEVAKAVAEIPKPADGRDADPEVIREMVAKAVAEIPTPRDGQDGKDADPAVIRAEVEKAVAEIPRPLNGKDGRDGENGKDVPIEVVQALVIKEVKEATKDIESGRDGRDGEPGRDAFQVDVLDFIDVNRRYQRGTWAKHNGGLWMARSPTNGMDGWDCILDGDAEDQVEVAEDMRTLTFRKVKSSGRVIEKSLSVPTQIYRGVWTEREHAKGDTVTFGGSLWHCNEPTTERPGESKAWTLAAKRGRDGRDGEIVSPKEPGTVKLR